MEKFHLPHILVKRIGRAKDNCKHGPKSARAWKRMCLSASLSRLAAKMFKGVPASVPKDTPGGLLQSLVAILAAKGAPRGFSRSLGEADGRQMDSKMTPRRWHFRSMVVCLITFELIVSRYVLEPV